MIGLHLDVLFGEIEVTECRKRGKRDCIVYNLIYTCVFVWCYRVLPYSWVTKVNFVCMSNCFAVMLRFLGALDA